jgi:hypothetical protein
VAEDMAMHVLVLLSFFHFIRGIEQKNIREIEGCGIFAYDDTFNQLVFVFINVKYAGYGVNNFFPLGGEVFVGTYEFEEFYENNYLLFLGEGFVDLLADPEGFN